MCGIIGFFSIQRNLNKEHLNQMVRTLIHRGPDAEGTYFSESHYVGLGHRRLSILDLSISANQPMHSHCGRYVIVYNGEVYNFRELAAELKYLKKLNWRSSGDTEVILEAFAQWGPDFVKKLNGMFAFAIYDKPEDKLYIYRDRVGIKPLYYFWDSCDFIFASELKAITSIKTSLKLNHKAISLFLHTGYIPCPHSIYEQVFKLDPGSYVIIDKKGIESVYYWQLENQISTCTLKNENDAVEKLNTLLRSSVAYRMISDVPFGTFLSGGVDSSLITAIAQSLSDKPISSFSIGFNKKQFNEAFHAKKIAKALGTNHYELIVKKKDAIGMIEKIPEIYDEPFGDSSAIPTILVSQMARTHVKMTLSGDGGDELFMGYGMYRWAERLNKPLIKAFRQPVRLMLSKMNNRARRASLLFDYKNNHNLNSHIFSQEQYFFSQSELEEILIGKPDGFSTLNIPENFHRPLKANEKQAFFDLKFYLVDDLLVKVDRASMYNSLETRVPILDYRIVEFALNLSPNLKMKDRQSKYLLKKVLFKYLSPKYFERPKQGFAIPLSNWLLTDLKYLIDDYLNKTVVEKFNIINYASIEVLKKNFLGGRNYLYNRIWLLIILHKWLVHNEKSEISVR